MPARLSRPAETPLHALLESLFETVKGVWEDLFAPRYGFWRGILDGVVARQMRASTLGPGAERSQASSGGMSKSTSVPLNPRVLTAPKTTPAAIQRPP